jgi:rare lipoprotein A
MTAHPDHDQFAQRSSKLPSPACGTVVGDEETALAWTASAAGWRLARPIRLTLLTLACGLYLAGCGSLNTRGTSTAPPSPEGREVAVVPPYTGGGYYKDDGPGANPPANLDTIPDAVPRREPEHPYANRIYKVKGKRYVPDVSGQTYKARGLASWYGRKFHGRPTSSGEPYDMYAMSAAHRTLPIPSYARVTNVATGDSVVVRVNDRGPFHADRVIDLSYTAAHKLGVLQKVTLVEVERLLPEQEGDDAPRVLTASVNPEPSDGAQEDKPRAATLADATEPQAGPAQAIYLQVGAFANPQAADELTGRLLQKLGRVIPGVLRLDEAELIKVQVGPFTSEAASDAAVEMLRAAVEVTPYRLSAATLAKAQQAVETPAPEAPPATAVMEPAYWLQLAAFSRAEAADALLQRVRTETPVPGVEARQEQGLTKVQVGPYANAALADAASNQLATLLGQRPYRLLR